MQFAINVLATALFVASVNSYRPAFNPINFGGGTYDPTYRTGAFPHRRYYGGHLARPSYGHFGSHYPRPSYGQFGSPYVPSGPVNGQPQGHLGHAGSPPGGEPIHTQGFVQPSAHPAGIPSVPSSGPVSHPAPGQKPVHAQGGNVQPGLSGGVVPVASGIVDVPHKGGNSVGPIPGQVAGGVPSVEKQPGGIPAGLTPSLTESAVPPNCKKFMKDPNGKYICDDAQVPESSAAFECPAVTPICPKLGERITPQQCESDTDCGGFGRCCRDACYEYSICKGAK
ncbi:uncharacterized protein [Macrobrachium rosenbergii]|uniref:uncharacterized protein n=1 Tax=Macrobrachium rosenbergii TaxID=79674 RepID=UPI0034D504CC